MRTTVLFTILCAALLGCSSPNQMTEAESAPVEPKSQFLFQTPQGGWNTCDEKIGDPKERISILADLVPFEETEQIPCIQLEDEYFGMLTIARIEGTKFFPQITALSHSFSAGLRKAGKNGFIRVKESYGKMAFGPKWPYGPFVHERVYFLEEVSSLGASRGVDAAFAGFNVIVGRKYYFYLALVENKRREVDDLVVRTAFNTMLRSFSEMAAHIELQSVLKLSPDQCYIGTFYWGR